MDEALRLNCANRLQAGIELGREGGLTEEVGEEPVHAQFARAFEEVQVGTGIDIFREPRSVPACAFEEIRRELVAQDALRVQLQGRVEEELGISIEPFIYSAETLIHFDGQSDSSGSELAFVALMAEHASRGNDLHWQTAGGFGKLFAVGLCDFVAPERPDQIEGELFRKTLDFKLGQIELPRIGNGGDQDVTRRAGGRKKVADRID